MSGCRAGMAARAKRGATATYERVRKVLGEGSLLLAASEVTFGGQAIAFYDLFRVEHDTIAEHWDTHQVIPPRAERKNAHGKF